MFAPHIPDRRAAARFAALDILCTEVAIPAYRFLVKLKALGFDEDTSREAIEGCQRWPHVDLCFKASSPDGDLGTPIGLVWLYECEPAKPPPIPPQYDEEPTVPYRAGVVVQIEGEE